MQESEGGVDVGWGGAGGAGFARRTRSHRSVRSSFARRGGIADDLFVPAGMVALGKSDGNIATNYRAERSALRKHTHVDVDQEQANGEERRGRVNENGKVAQEAEIQRDAFREPKNEAASE